MNENYNERIEDDDEIDLIALAMALLRHWKVIVIVTLVTAIACFLFSRFLITPMYSSMSRLYVLSKSTSITSLADIQMGSNLTNDYLIVCSSRPVLDQVIADLELDEEYKTLKGKVKVTNPSNTRFLDITVTDVQPERAKAIADDIAEVSSRFISEKMDQDPPSIIQYGYADGAKVSPNVMKNTVIAGFAGGVVSVAFVALFYFLNNTIDTPDDVENKLGLKTIAQIPMEHFADNESKEEKKHKKAKKGRKAEK
jgi:capsular polysaccharide biosynthesis protein